MRSRLGKSIAVLAALGLVVAVLVLAGCGSGDKTTTTRQATNTTAAGTGTAAVTVSTAYSGPTTKVVFATSGVACEAAIYVAKEKGIFAKYGLDVELKSTGFDETKVGLATGKIDATDGNFAWIKPIQEGLNLKYVGGIHKGCITGVSPKGSSIKTVADLKGKRLGVNAIGDGPYILALTALKNVGLSEKDVTFKVYPADQLPLALKKGEIDAFIDWDPYAAQYLAANGGQYWFENNVTPPFDKSWCCHLVVGGSYADKNPDVVKRLWEAVAEGATWVGQNIDATAQLEVDKKYLSGDPKTIAERLRSYIWEPSTTDAKPALLDEIKNLTRLGVLDSKTDTQKLLDQIWFPLPK